MCGGITRLDYSNVSCNEHTSNTKQETTQLVDLKQEPTSGVTNPQSAWSQRHGPQYTCKARRVSERKTLTSVTHRIQIAKTYPESSSTYL